MFTKEDFKSAVSTTVKFTRGHNYRSWAGTTHRLSGAKGREGL